MRDFPAILVTCGLRSYLPKDHPDKHREIGQEKTPEAFVETMVHVFREVRRCLHDSGTLFLNLGDSYFGGGRGGNPEESAYRKQATNAGSLVEPTAIPAGCKPKDLCMIPWRVALALQADGWWLRSVICWHKKSCMPESVTDRPTNSWEPIFLLAKSQRYFYDHVAVMEKADYGEQHANKATSWGTNRKHPNKANVAEYAFAGENHTCHKAADGSYSRNQRNVWSLGPEPYSEAHFATFPTEIPRRAILAGTSAKGCCPKCYAPWERVVEKETINGVHGGLRKRADAPGAEVSPTSVFRTGADTQTRTVGWQPSCSHPSSLIPQPSVVLDPFGGSGTTGAVAIELGRRAILCELNDHYLTLIEKRTNVTPGLNLA